MPTLHELQRVFGASALFGDDEAVSAQIVEDGFTAAERLRIYRNTCRSVLTEALRLSYPAVDRLVGRDFFDMAVARFIREHPPGTGYLNEYGGAFADFLAALPEAATLAYLADVSRFEWALNIAANAPDALLLDMAALAEIGSDQHADLRFVPHPSVHLLRLEYPADEIADAVLSGSDDAMGAIDLSSGPVWLAVHRGPEGVEAQRLAPDSWRLVQRLCRGEPLGSLLESGGADIADLLAEQFVKGRLAAFRLGSSGAPPAIKETIP